MTHGAFKRASWRLAVLAVATTAAAAGEYAVSPADVARASSGTLSTPTDLTPDATSVSHWELSDDGRWLSWRDRVSATEEVLWARRTDGAGEPVRLSPPTEHPSTVRNWGFTPDSTHVVFVFDGATEGEFTWWSAPLATGAAGAVTLSDVYYGNSSSDWVVTPDSRYLVYPLSNSDGSWTRFSVPVGGAPTQLHEWVDSLSASTHVPSVLVTPDSSTVVFGVHTPDGRGLFATPIGGGPLTELTTGPPPTWIGQLFLSPDGSRVLHEIPRPDGTVALVSTVVASGASLTLAEGAAGGCCRIEGVFAGDAGAADRVVYERKNGPGGDDSLWVAPVDGSTVPVRLNTDAGHDQLIGAATMSPAGLVVYISDELIDGQFELFTADAAAPSTQAVRVSPPLDPDEDVSSEATLPWASPDSTQVAYHLSGDDGPVLAISSARSNGPPNTVAGPPPGHVIEGLWWSPDSDLVAWTARDSTGTSWLALLTPTSGVDRTTMLLNRDPVPAGDIGLVAVADAVGGTHVVFDVRLPAFGQRHVWSVTYAKPETPGPVVVNPARLLETRPGLLTADGADQAVGRRPAGSTYELRVTGRGEVPANASGVLLNVAAVGPAAAGHLIVSPCGEPQPHASSLNYGAQQTVANAAIAKVGADGKVCIFTHAETDIIVDINGYLPADATPTVVNPARLLETRQGARFTTIDGAHQGVGRLTGGAVYELQATGRGGVPADAIGVIVNTAAVSPGGPGHVTIAPCGVPLPTASNLNYRGGTTVAGATIVKVGHDGKICIRSHADTDLVVDVNGYIPPDGHPDVLTPARVLDTRTDPGNLTVDGLHQQLGRVASGAIYELDVSGRAGIPAGASGFVANVAAVGPGGNGHLTVASCDAPLPNASNVNYSAGVTVANLVIAKLDPDGKICIRAHADTELIVDITGYIR